MSGEPVRAHSVLKWAGGKKQLLDELMARVPASIGTYHEPFVGGGALFFALASEKRFDHARLSDLNPDLIGTYRALAGDPDRVIEELRRHRNEESYFYEVRDQDPAGLSDAARAARLIYLNKTCYNGLYRVNSRGKFNVPFGRFKSPNFCDEKNLRAAAALLREAEISLESFEQVARVAVPGDFVYFDPPYQPVNDTSFTAYTKAGFGEDLQWKLAKAFGDLADRKVAVLLSNSNTPLIRKLYRRFKIEVVLATRAINSRAEGRGKVEEVLVSYFPSVRSARPRPSRRRQAHPALPLRTASGS